MDIEFLWFIERYQTLVSGVLAIVAAAGTAIAIYRSAKYPVDQERLAEEERRTKELDIAKLELHSWLCRVAVSASNNKVFINEIFINNYLFEELDDGRVIEGANVSSDLRFLLLPYPKIVEDRVLFSEFESDVITCVVKVSSLIDLHNNKIKKIKFISALDLHIFEENLDGISELSQKACESISLKNKELEFAFSHFSITPQPETELPAPRPDASR